MTVMCRHVRDVISLTLVLIALLNPVATNDDSYALAHDEDVRVISSAHGRPTTPPPTSDYDITTVASSFLDALIAVLNSTKSNQHRNITATDKAGLFDSVDPDTENQPRNLASWLRDSLIGRRWRRRQVPQKPAFLIPANPYMPPGRPIAPPPHPGYSVNGNQLMSFY